jgi:type IV secretory pathway TrbL component
MQGSDSTSSKQHQAAHLEHPELQAVLLLQPCVRQDKQILSGTAADIKAAASSSATAAAWGVGHCAARFNASAQSGVISAVAAQARSLGEWAAAQNAVATVDGDAGGSTAAASRGFIAAAVI